MLFFPFMAAWLEGIIILAAILATVLFLENKVAKGATILWIIILAVSYISKGWAYNFVGAVDPFALLVGTAVYLFAGLIWSFFRWGIYISGKFDPRRSIEDVPSAKDKLGMISSWIFYWPFSLAWTFSSNILSKFGKWIAKSFMGVYDRISLYLFRRFLDAKGTTGGNGASKPVSGKQHINKLV